MLQTQLNESIRAYLRENKAPEILIHFVQERLDLDSLVGHFVEELKQDTQLWRSQQILFAQGYLSSLSRLEQGQSTILERLDTFIAASKNLSLNLLWQ